VAVLSEVPDGSFALIAERASVAASALEGLRELRRRRAPQPVIQILRAGETRADATDGWAADAVSARECRSCLAFILRRVVIRWLLAASFEATSARYRDTTVLLELFQVVFSADPPVGSATELGALMGEASRSGAYAAWDRVIRPMCGLTLGDFLGWVVLLRGFGVKAPGWGWRAVGRCVGKSPHGLDGLSRRLLGMRCKDTEALGLRPLLEFLMRVLTPLGLADER
jgi:hypothetical protein